MQKHQVKNGVDPRKGEKVKYSRKSRRHYLSEALTDDTKIDLSSERVTGTLNTIKGPSVILDLSTTPALRIAED